MKKANLTWRRKGAGRIPAKPDCNRKPFSPVTVGRQSPALPVTATRTASLLSKSNPEILEQPGNRWRTTTVSRRNPNKLWWDLRSSGQSDSPRTAFGRPLFLRNHATAPRNRSELPTSCPKQNRATVSSTLLSRLRLSPGRNRGLRLATYRGTNFPGRFGPHFTLRPARGPSNEWSPYLSENRGDTGRTVQLWIN